MQRNLTPWFIAVQNNHDEVLELLLKSGVDINAHVIVSCICFI